MIFNSDYVGINISKTDCKSAFEVFVQGGMLESIANGGSFLEGFEDGALSGAISGAIGGAAFAGLGQLGAVAGKGIKCMSGFVTFSYTHLLYKLVETILSLVYSSVTKFCI